MLSRLWFALRSLVLRRRADAEIDEELGFHLEREAALLMRDGMSPADARREATRRFGDRARYREECRDVRHVSWLDDARADIHFALRLVRFHPGFSANVVMIAALGIAACVTTFSLVSGILLSPLPFSAPERIAGLELRSADGTATVAFPIDAYLRLAAGSPVLDGIAAFSPGGVAANWNGEPERLRTELVTPSFFNVFGIAPLLGRPFTPKEAADRAPVALLGHELWRTRFNADPTVIGRRLTLDDAPYTIIGVMPPRFRAHLTSEPDLWLPMDVAGNETSTGRNTVNVLLRIAGGSTREHAQAWLATAVRTRIPSSTRRDSVDASPALYPITDLVYGYVKAPLLVLLGAVGLVFLLVAANIATIFVARSTARARELAMRRALGASAGRQLRQLVTEAATLTAIGGMIGTAASYWAVDVIRGLGARILPRMDAVTLDWRVLLFAVAGTMIIGIIGGIAPALLRRRADTTGADASGTRVTGHRTSSALVVAQIALSVVLIVGAGLLMKVFLRVLPTDPGFALENRAALIVSLRGQPGFADTAGVGARRFLRDVTERMRLVKGVRDVAATSFPPFFGSVSIIEIEVQGHPTEGKPFTAFQNLVTPNYFDVMRIPLRRGRAFSASDEENAERVAIINEMAASRWWPGEDPIGKAMTTVWGRSRVGVTVVGVVADGRLFGQDTKPRPEIYLPVTQGTPRYITFVVHTSVVPGSIAHELRRSVWRVAPNLPIETSDLATLASESVRRERFYSVAMSVFAIAAVGLTALGIYGLLAFAVAQRRREIGIRIALGAPLGHIGAMVLRRALGIGVTGVVVGVVLARGLSRYMSSLLVEVSASDGIVFLATAVAVLAIAVAAACVPAYQAVRVDPIQSLRV